MRVIRNGNLEKFIASQTCTNETSIVIRHQGPNSTNLLFNFNRIEIESIPNKIDTS